MGDWVLMGFVEFTASLYPVLIIVGSGVKRLVADEFKTRPGRIIGNRGDRDRRRRR